jgi:uncharacterized protein HemX
MLTGTSATRVAPPTSETRPHRRMEPLDEPAPRRAPARRASAPPPARKKKKSGSGTRLFVGLLVVAALAAAGIFGYQAVADSGSKSVQLREDVRGNVGNAIEELRGLIDDNTQ